MKKKLHCKTRTVCGPHETTVSCLVDDVAPETQRSPGAPDEAREFGAWFTVEAGVEELRRTA